MRVGVRLLPVCRRDRRAPGVRARLGLRPDVLALSPPVRTAHRPQRRLGRARVDPRALLDAVLRPAGRDRVRCAYLRMPLCGARPPTVPATRSGAHPIHRARSWIRGCDSVASLEVRRELNAQRQHAEGRGPHIRQGPDVPRPSRAPRARRADYFVPRLAPLEWCRVDALRRGHGARALAVRRRGGVAP